MAISQLPQSPYRQDRKTLPTALSTDVLFSEIRDGNRSEFPAYGTPYPDSSKWPDHKLVFIKPVDIERANIFEFFYAADRENQDLYNFAFGYRNIIGNVGGREFRNVQRMYVTARESFAPHDIPFGTPMPNVPEDKFEGVNYVFFDRQQQKIDRPELDSLYVLEVHTYVETAFLDEGLSYSAQREDPLPAKFRIAIPQQQTETMVVGQAEMPALSTGELTRSEDQLNPNVKLVKKVTRDLTTAPVLNSKVVTNVLQVADVEESIVDDGETITASALTVDGSVESLGDGKSVKKVITAPELFTAQSFSTQRPDVTPEKFRVAIPTETTEESVAGIAEPPTLAAGELAATEQQVNVFVKRKQKTKRNAATSTLLTEHATDNTKQLATVTETYQTGDTDETPSATVDITSQALGDGTYVVRKIEVPEVFAASQFVIEKPEYIPVKFQATIPSTTVETSEAGTATQPALGLNDIAASEQQVNKFVKRTQRKTRAIPSNVTLTGSEFSQAVLYATTDELVDVGAAVKSGPLVVESVVAPIGGGKAVRTSKSVTTGAYSSSNPATRRIETRVTPLETDIIFIETGVMPETSMAYGTAHYDSSQWPNHKLVLIKPAGRDGVLYEFYYAADRQNQDEYNLVDQNGQYLTRSYIILRSDYYNRSQYADTVPTVGVSPDPVFGSTDPIYGDFVFSGESVKHTGTELDSLYVEVERTYQLKEEVTYEFNETLEKTFKVTKRVVARNSSPEPAATGKIVQRQNVNAWHDIEMITELKDRETYFDGAGKFIPIELPDVPKDVQYNFPNLLNYVDAEAYLGDDSIDVVCNFNLISAPAGPFEARVMRVITDDPDYYRTLYPVVNLHPKRELINVWTKNNTRQIEVPASVHGGLEIGLELASTGSGSTSDSERVLHPYLLEGELYFETFDGVVSLLRKPLGNGGIITLAQVTSTLPKTSDYYRLTGGGELVVGYDVAKTSLNLYMVSIIFVNIDGLYTADSDSAYSGELRQQIVISNTNIPHTTSYTLTRSENNVYIRATVSGFNFRLESAFGNIVDTGFKRTYQHLLGTFYSDQVVAEQEAIAKRLGVYVSFAREAYIRYLTNKLQSSFLNKHYYIRVKDKTLVLTSLTQAINPASTTMSYGGTTSSTSTLIPA